MSGGPTSQLENIRNRTGMYVGNTGGSGRRLLLWSLLSYAIDEAMTGTASAISVSLHTDGSATVSDDGMGIWFPLDPEGAPLLSVAFDPECRGPAVPDPKSSRLNSLEIGPGVVAALCSSIAVDVCRLGLRYTQMFSRGLPTSDFSSEPCGDEQGTSVHLLPDPEIFDSEDWDVEVTTKRLLEVGALLPGISVAFSQDQVDLAPSTSLRRLLDDACRGAGGWSHGQSVAEIQLEDSDGSVRIALLWRKPWWNTSPQTDLSPVIAPWCNFRRIESPLALSEIKAGLGEAMGVDPNNAVVGEALVKGLVAAVDLKVISPHFEGPTGQRLVSAAAESLIRRVISLRMPSWFDSQTEMKEELLGRLTSR